MKQTEYLGNWDCGNYKLSSLSIGIVRGIALSKNIKVVDPTEGYGIFIENMLSAANNKIQPKAA